MDLFIDDGYTARVGFKEAPGRAEVEFDLRPFAGADGNRQYLRTRLADDATNIVIGDMLGDGKDQPARISEWSFPRELTRENLRKLRSPEFTLLMLAMYDQVIPDYEYVDHKRVPYKLTAEREKN
ncbi:MAG: hypothetical protein H0T51_15075 [Pirellulales bacterium]|nr:hypothetical protein [Pirellulales bacterium]